MCLSRIGSGVWIVVPERFHKSTNDRMLLGVAGGIAEYFGINSVGVRMGFVLCTLAGGAGIWIYVVLAIILPAADPPRRASA
jgi:phage shock protein PspC (stress-responsive transcriptional regulator)